MKVAAAADVLGASGNLLTSTMHLCYQSRYVVTVSLGQKAGAGLHAASTARWNPRTDGKLCVHWESATVQALVTVYWAAV